ncbi:sensor histidine kinase [Paenibacillus shenyangensis]|uniref:sensor histidine kinase n=1 Tax=Paenibacillus sp. A9 TaxID=1284352 RepID=UPI0003821AE2|nr:ATP-binding protein [Paenibacillus sp. A9]
MEFVKNFLMNAGMMVTIAYIANLLYKYGLSRMSGRAKYASSILLLIFAGWMSSFFGFRLPGNLIFDLRFMPVIVAAAVYSRAWVILLIGFGIGLTRLTFGLSEAAFVGLLNLTILGAVGAVLNVWMRSSAAKLLVKGTVTVLAINLVNTVNIATFGVLPTRTYLTEIMPIMLPVSTVLSAVLMLLLREFHLEQQRMMQLEHANQLLSEQTRELQQTHHVLEERAKQLMLASQYKSEFLANMSHELRTPLNSIINLAQLLYEQEEERTPGETRVYSEMIYRSGLDLLGLVNDVLDLSKVEAGKLEITYEEVSVQEIPELLQMHFEMIAIRKGMEFRVIREEDVPDTIISDSQRIQQILRNLLANAFKFTQQGSVTLHIHRVVEGEEQLGWLVFDVTDTGIGIAQAQHEQIFEAFQQADGSIARRYGGTGLGLSISRNLANLLGGHLRLQSKEGEGSVFSLYLPTS